MHCPYCGHADQKVLDSRPCVDGEAIRRRRECSACGRRFTTFERPERPRLFVIKRNEAREEFSREKVFESMRVACRKRPVKVEVLRSLSERIERDLYQDFEDEVKTREIGERVMRELAPVDTVAYVRFASVYREFKTVSDFAHLIEEVQRDESIASLLGLQEALL
jgi:transcriptional repressor NrdR